MKYIDLYTVAHISAPGDQGHPLPSPMALASKKLVDVKTAAQGFAAIRRKGFPGGICTRHRVLP